MGIVPDTYAVLAAEKGYDGFGNCVLLGSDLLETKFKYFPLILSQKGVTIRIDMSNAPYLARGSKSFLGPLYADNNGIWALGGGSDTPADIHFKFTETTLWYEAIIIPDSFKI